MVCGERHTRKQLGSIIQIRGAFSRAVFPIFRERRARPRRAFHSAGKARKTIKARKKKKKTNIYICTYEPTYKYSYVYIFQQRPRRRDHRHRRG